MPFTRLMLLPGALLLMAAVSAARPQQTPSPAAATAQRWFKGNTHTHTLNSDGDSTPDEVVRWYREHGYHFLVLTDHNYLTTRRRPQRRARRRGQVPGRSRRRGDEHRQRQGRARQRPESRDARGAADGGVGRDSRCSRTSTASGAANGVPHINHPNFTWAMTADELRPGRAHPALRDLQRPPAGQQRRRRRSRRASKRCGIAS